MIAVVERRSMDMDKELITAQVLAETLDLSVETIWRYTREKKIPCIELGNRHYRYRLEDVIIALGGNALREKPDAYKTEPTKNLHMRTTWTYRTNQVTAWRFLMAC